MHNCHMSPLHHLLIAWLIANIVETDAQTRRFVLVMGLISDIDGFPVLFSDELFLAYHHTFSHTLVFGIVIAAIFIVFVKKRLLGFSLFVLAFVTHLGGDIVGSWGVPVFAPFIPDVYSLSTIVSVDVMYGIIYPVVQVLVWIGTLAILIFKKRTPMEFFSVRWDRILVNFLTLPFTTKCGLCERRASFKCENCSIAICRIHVAGGSRQFLCSECEDRMQQSDL